MTQTYSNPPVYDASAATSYISGRPAPAGQAPDNIVTHRLQLGLGTSPAASILSFPQPEHVWMSRDVDHADWSVFTKQLVTAPTTGIGDKKEEGLNDGELDESAESARRDHMLGLMAEWNRDFFAPRGFKVLPMFGEEVGEDAAEYELGEKSSTASGNNSRGFGFKVGKNSLVGLALPPNSHGYGIRLGGVLLGVKLGDDKKDDKSG